MSKVQKLIQQYTLKLEQFDAEIKITQEIIRKARHEGEDCGELRMERKMLSDKRQIYYQFIKDL